jgi:hypothetical protein
MKRVLLLLAVMGVVGCGSPHEDGTKQDAAARKGQLDLVYAAEMASPDPELAIARDFDTINDLLSANSIQKPCRVCRFLVGGSNGYWDKTATTISFGKIYSYLTDDQRVQVARTLADVWGGGTDVVRPVLNGSQPDDAARDQFVEAITDMSQRLPDATSKFWLRCAKLVRRWGSPSQQASAEQLVRPFMPLADAAQNHWQSQASAGVTMDAMK